MVDWSRVRYLTVLAVFFAGGCSLPQKASNPNSQEKQRLRAASMIRTSRRVLAPVYAPLAEHIVDRLALEDKTGIGIDVGSGPGTLIIELCERTRMNWVNADINPYSFAHFFTEAERRGFAHRVGAIQADVHDLPFRTNYADVILSRGSFHLWRDKVRAFAEIYRVLKPGATAYVGRGFSENLPVRTATEIRKKQGRRMKYDVEKTADELRMIMNKLAIQEYQIHRPRADLYETVNYGVWVEFRKSRLK